MSITFCAAHVPHMCRAAKASPQRRAIRTKTRARRFVGRKQPATQRAWGGITLHYKHMIRSASDHTFAVPFTEIIEEFGNPLTKNHFLTFGFGF